MRTILVSAVLLMASVALAQQVPLNVPHPPPADPLLTADEVQVVKDAIAELKAKGLDVNYTAVEPLSEVVGPTQLPMVGFALSRASADPKACALLKRIEPSAVCVR